MSDPFIPTSIDSALSVILQGVQPVTHTESLGLNELGGRILARPITSPADIPEQPISAMDGISICGDCLNNVSATIPLQVKILGKSLAGHALQGEVNKEAACRIFTGAVVHPPHDTVIAQELVEFQADDSVARFSPDSVKKGANVRSKGEDLSKGSIALAAGQLIGPRETALLASMGLASAEVFRRVRIAVLSTGDEVTEPGRPLKPGKIFDANRPMLLEMIRQCNATAIDLGVIGDEPDGLRQAITHAASIADAVITSGGVSVGEADHTKDVMRSLGEIAFWKLAIKPGRPLAAGKIRAQITADAGTSSDRQVPFFGLPGNPVAAFVTFKSVVEPCLCRLSGARASESPRIRARLAKDARKALGRTEYLRCALSRDAQGEWIAEIAASQGAASLKSLADADGLVILPHGSGPLAAGTAVDVIPLR